MNYYNKPYFEGKGDSYVFQKMMKVANFVDPLFLYTWSDTEIITILHLLTYLLKLFGFCHFKDSFIQNLKKEMLFVVKEAKHDHNLDGIKRSKKFYTRMEHCEKRK
eukprot:3546485-Ditylum_brightwellii.AAC.1